MTTLNRHLYALISDAVKCEGSFDPELVVGHFEEHLTIGESADVHNFLAYVHNNGKSFGSGNYQQLYREFKETLKVNNK